MRLLLLAALVALAFPAQAQERPPAAPKLFASDAEVEGLIAKAKAEHKTGNTVEIVASVGPYPVQLEYRTAVTPPSLHKGQAELIYVVGGGCTLITGGTLVNAKPGAGFNMSGTAIEGGSSRKIAKGDYVLVPPDTPHQYTQVDGEFISVTLHMPMTQ